MALTEPHPKLFAEIESDRPEGNMFVGGAILPDLVEKGYLEDRKTTAQATVHQLGHRALVSDEIHYAPPKKKT